MRLDRTKLGAGISYVWIGVVVYLFLRDPSATLKMAPNEWGDFLAGSFAPLAFLWLVLGYLQQGDELRLSTDALRLQAEELRNSVQQQRELVEVSRQQVESAREALVFERRLREDLSQPKFRVEGSGGSFGGDGSSCYHITFTNSGHDSTAFAAYMRLPNGQQRTLLSRPLFGKGAQYNAILEMSARFPTDEAKLLLQFVDGLGRTVQHSYRVRPENESPTAGLKFERIEA
jgi:hypothetical protein